jgi:hypothetical protein
MGFGASALGLHAEIHGVMSRLRTQALLSLSGLLVLAGSIAPAQAQRVVPKLGNICPMGYVDTLDRKSVV